jgi:lysyl-tRNA synthetase class II
MSTEKDNPLRAEKRRKLHELKKAGLNPFPHNFKPTHKVGPVFEKHSEIEVGQQLQDVKVKMAGRLMTRRDMGKAAFFNFQDQSGSLQGYVKIEELDPDSQKFFEQIENAIFNQFRVFFLQLAFSLYLRYSFRCLLSFYILVRFSTLFTLWSCIVFF